jgi:hypothetical protein
MTSSNLVPRNLPIVGSAEQVRTALLTQYRQGRLVTDPRAVALRRNRDGTVTADVTVLVDQQLPFPWRKRHPVLTPVLIVGGAVAVLFAAGVSLLYLTLRTMSGALDRPAALGALVILGALGVAFAARRKSDCPGVVVHCRDHKR